VSTDSYNGRWRATLAWRLSEVKGSDEITFKVLRLCSRYHRTLSISSGTVVVSDNDPEDLLARYKPGSKIILRKATAGECFVHHKDGYTGSYMPWDIEDMVNRGLWKPR
jgi:hypothetical protein